MQDINEELIDNFFKGLCTKEEAVTVVEFLKKHPDHPYLLREWDAADGQTPLPAHYSLDMYDAVVAHTAAAEKSNGQLKLLWRMAAAACVITIFISLWHSSVKTSTPETVAITRSAQPVEWTERQNTRDTSVAVSLPEGSKIILSPKAWVRYRKDFGQSDRRDIYLQGQAFFEVSKNKEKPFTVFSGFISTTALGTAFRVTDPEDGHTIKVRLHEGKVMVAVTDSVYKKMHAPYYLSPGEEIVFTAINKPGIVHAFLRQKDRVALDSDQYATPPATDASYKFNNQQLPVFGIVLSVMFCVLCLEYVVNKPPLLVLSPTTTGILNCVECCVLCVIGTCVGIAE